MFHSTKISLAYNFTWNRCLHMRGTLGFRGTQFAKRWYGQYYISLIVHLAETSVMFYVYIAGKEVQELIKINAMLKYA